MIDHAKKAQHYLYSAHAGALLMVALGLAFAFDLPDFGKGFIVGMLIVIVLALFRSKARDEYVERLWNAGTAAAFLVTLSMTVGADLARGFVDGLLGNAPSGAVGGFDAPTVGTAALAAFFMAFHVAMIREDA